MSNSASFPKRTVHLDFHTGPAIPDVASDFNAKEFAETFKQAHIDSVTVFAKCHHGHLYYNTPDAARHPSLPDGLNLLGEQIEALHAVGIRAPIYLSVQCDEYAANTHPDWIALDAELRQVKWGSKSWISDGPFGAGWQILDMASPYQDYLADQLADVLRRFKPVDGIFMDMCWDQISVSKWAVDAMKRDGLDPSQVEDRSKFARVNAQRYMARYHKMIRQAEGSTRSMGVWFNSRPKTNLAEEAQFNDHIEIEALPTGGWGYAYFPYVARFVRPLGMDTLSHTGRFHLSWGDNAGLKPAAALKFETCQILSQGLANGVGDLLHPRGVPQSAVYELIGQAYSHVARCEPFVEGATHPKEVALIVDPQLGDNPGPAALGAVRALQQLRLQFDILPPHHTLDGYALALLPESAVITPELADNLTEFMKGGGKLLVTGAAALNSDGQPAMPGSGFTAEGASPFSHTFLRATEASGLPPSDLDCVMYERGFRMRPAADAVTLCGIVEPYFERTYDRFSGHSYTPPAKLSSYAAAVQSGNAITFSVPIFEAFAQYANTFYLDLLRATVRRLLPTPMVRVGGPAHVEATLVNTAKAAVVHLISFLPVRLAGGLDLVTDSFPLVDTPVEVRLSHRPQSVRLQPHDVPLPFDFSDGYVRTKVTLLDGHGMIVIE